MMNLMIFFFSGIGQLFAVKPAYLSVDRGKGVLSRHGGYYDLVDCTFEKWALDYKESIMDGKNRVAVKNRSVWC